MAKTTKPRKSKAKSRDGGSGSMNIVGKDRKINVKFRIENIVASASLGVELDLFTIATEVDNVEYEPEQFPGAIMRLKSEGLGTTLLLFKNGKMICSGAKNRKQIENSILAAVRLLKPYMK